MLRLIKADFASARKPDLRDGAPSCFLNFRPRDTLFPERGHFGFQAFTQEVKFVRAILIAWVECDLCRRQGEDQSTMTRVHGF
jgi:hypothetical protein